MSKSNALELDSDCRMAARECVGLAVRKASRAAAQHYDDALAPSGLRSTQFSVLTAIVLLDAPQISTLADTLVMDRTTLTRNLRLLDRDGLIRIEAGADRRTRTVAISPRGRSALKRALPLWREAHNRLLSALGRQRAKRLRDELSALVTEIS